jgi:hypothetical protein
MLRRDFKIWLILQKKGDNMQEKAILAGGCFWGMQ